MIFVIMPRLPRFLHPPVAAVVALIFFLILKRERRAVTGNLRRVSVDPRYQARGVASAMVGCAEEVAVRRGLSRVNLIARVELPDTVEFWSRRGYSVVDQQGHNLIYAKAMPIELTVPTADDMQAIGEELASQLRAGDVLVATTKQDWRYRHPFGMCCCSTPLRRLRLQGCRFRQRAEFPDRIGGPGPSAV